MNPESGVVTLSLSSPDITPLNEEFSVSSCLGWWWWWFATPSLGNTEIKYHFQKWVQVLNCLGTPGLRVMQSFDNAEQHVSLLPSLSGTTKAHIELGLTKPTHAQLAQYKKQITFQLVVKNVLFNRKQRCKTSMFCGVA